MKQRIVPIALDGVYAYLIIGEQVILVDTGMPGTENKIIDEIQHLGIPLSALKLIILTHGHSDHFGGSSLIKEQTGAQVLIHASEAESVRTGINPKLHGAGLMGKVLSKVIPRELTHYKGYEAELKINEEISLEAYGVQGKIVFLPGHTKGSIGVLLKDGDLLVGDAVQGSFVGKKLKYPLFIEDRGAFYQSLEKIVSIATGNIYAGHGGQFTINDVKRLMTKRNTI